MSDYNIEQDPLAAPAGDLRPPAYPVLVEGVKTLQVAGFEEKVFNKNGTETRMLQVSLRTTEVDRDTENRTVHPGFTFQASLFITPNEQNSAKEIAERVAMVVKGILGKETRVSAREIINDPSLVVGKQVRCKVGIRKSKSEEYSDTNTVKVWGVPNA